MADPVSVRDVCAEECDDIKKRREKAGLSSEDASQDLVGLALSGGALRSASFSLGVVQAFQRIGLWRYVDYLSTVSGGGYVGSFITSSTLKAKKSPSKYDQPLNELKSDRQKPRVLRLIYGGHYLLRAWRLANTYLIGLVGINLAIVSGITAVCALVAFLWRCLDYPFVSDRLAMLVPESDYHRAFWPFYFFFIAWLVSWSISLFRRGGDARGDVARHLLVITVGSLLVGIALLIGNGDIAGWQDLAGNNKSIGGEVWGPIVALVLGGLLPFLSPKRLLKSGLNPEKEWERYVFGIASTALLVGLPLVIVSTLARENISGFNNDPYREIVAGDIQNWPGLCDLLTHTSGDTEGKKPILLGDLATEVVVDAKDVERLQRAFTKEIEGQDVSEFKNLSELAAALDKLETDRQAKHATYFGIGKWGRTTGIDYVKNMIAVTSFWDENDAMDYWHAKTASDAFKKVVCKLLNDDSLLGSKEYLADHMNATKKEQKPPATSPRPWLQLAFSFGDFNQSLGFDKQTSKTGGNELDRGQLATLERMPDYEVKQKVRSTLESEHPTIFRERTQVRRLVSIYEDQKSRLIWLAGSIVVFLAAGIWIDLNSVSPHRYYKNRLANAFIAGRTSKSPSIALSEMDTAEYGGPYHLISASVGVIPDKLGAETVSPQRDKDSFDRHMDLFLFSRLYCGSELTGYLDTTSYEHSVVGYANRLDLAEATAISGGALSPGHVRNWLLAFLMLALNLSMGQWIPNPRARRPRHRPRVLTVLGGLWKRPEDRPYCFASDGGHMENLGLTQLLKRHCKLIIVADASCDAKHEFGDLGRAIRLARIHDGVKLLAIDQDPGGHDRELDVSDLKLDADGKCKRHFVLARIRYEDGEEGLLVYLKPSFDGDESPDLEQFRIQNHEFPHEPTSDQLFDESQVESYRYLGYHIGMRLQNLLPAEFRPGELWDYGAEVGADQLVDWFVENRHRTHGGPPDQAISNAVDATDAEIDAARPLANQLLSRLQEEFPEPADIQASRFCDLMREEKELQGVELVKAVTAVQCAVLDKKHQTATNREYCVWLLDVIEADDQIPTNLDETIQLLLAVAKPGQPDRVRLAAIATLAIMGRGKHHRSQVIESLETIRDDSKASIRLAVRNALSNLRVSARKPR